MHIQIIVLFIIIIKTKCSVVYDEFNQNGVHLSDYCPEIGKCKQGSHVMCTHYNPNKPMGPICSGFKNVTMTEEYAALLLDLINTIRSRAARGLAMGYDNGLLPRAYGMFRVQWDPELATLAQVWANQCIVKLDNCRATKKFPDPGQLASLTRFVSDEWTPLSKLREKDYVNTPGFNKNKILYAIQSNIRSWYTTSEEIDSEIITDRNSSWSIELIRNPYLQIVDGSVTHMGCGTSAFKEYYYEQDTTYLIYNVIRLVCNFSSRVRDRRGIYNTNPPTKVNYTAECGCPPGYDEDSGCLCYESVKNQTKSCKNPKKPGKFQLVVLPIFTVEDYPRAHANSMIDRKKYQALNKMQHQSHATANRRYMPNGTQGRSLSATSIFKLTSRKMKEDTQLDNIKKDVAPRKDFSKSKNLLANYLSKRRTFNFQNKTLTRQDNSFRRSLPIKSIKPPTDNYIRRNTYKNLEDEKAEVDFKLDRPLELLTYSLDKHYQILKVDARDVIPYGSIYGSMERRLKLTKINPHKQPEIGSFENEKAEFPVYKRRRKKKKHHNVKDNNELLSTSTKKKEERKNTNKKRKKKPKYNKRFIKATLKNTDSNMSDSKENDSKNKPVDIIVHIKMND